MLTTFLINSAVVYLSNLNLGNHTVLLKQAVASGMFDAIPEQSVLLIYISNHFELLPPELQFRYSYYPFFTDWISQSLLYAHTGKKFITTYTLDQLVHLNVANLAPQGKVYQLDFTYFPDKNLIQNSYVRISKVTNLQTHGNDLYATQLIVEPIETYAFNQNTSISGVGNK